MLELRRRPRVKIETTFEQLAVAVIGLYLLTVASGLSGVPIPVLGPAVGFVAVIVVPGVLFLRLIGVKPKLEVTWLPYVFGVGMVVAMVVWFLVNVGLGVLGYLRPLSAIPMAASMTGVSVLLIATIHHVREPYSLEISSPTFDDLSPITLATWLLPLLAVLATSVLNTTGNKLPLIAVFVVIATVPIVVAASDTEHRSLPLVTWSISLAILFHASLWVGHTYGGHMGAITVWKAARWELAGETLLQNAILLPGMAHALGVDILTLMDIFLPLLVSILPVTLYISFKPWVGARKAFLGACLFAFAHPFYYLYPGVPRGGIPVLFLGLLGALIGDERLDGMRMRVVVLLFGFGLAVSHYGTSYYVLFALGGAFLTLYLLDGWDRLIEVWAGHRMVSDGGIRRELAGARPSVQPRIRLFMWTFIVFYLTVVIGWYLFVGEGARFEGIVEHIVSSYLDLLFNPGGQGSTAARLGSDYGSLSIFLSKHLYLSMAALTGLGLAAAYAKRLTPRRSTRFSDEFLAFALFLFLLFGGTFVISGEWGGGRPMMIVLSLNAVFTVIGIETIALIPTGVGAVFDRVRVPIVASEQTAVLAADISFAVVIATFLMINAGVISAVAFQDRAPNGVLSTDVEDIHIATDLATHVWFTDHRDATRDIYGDQATYGGAADAMNGEIAARSQRGTYRIRGGGNLGELNGTGVESGYVILLAHNVEEGIVEESYIISRPLAGYELDLERRNKVYSTGKSAVYFTNSSG